MNPLSSATKQCNGLARIGKYKQQVLGAASPTFRARPNSPKKGKNQMCFLFQLPPSDYGTYAGWRQIALQIHAPHSGAESPAKPEMPFTPRQRACDVKPSLFASVPENSGPTMEAGLRQICARALERPAAKRLDCLRNASGYRPMKGNQARGRRRLLGAREFEIGARWGTKPAVPGLGVNLLPQCRTFAECKPPWADQYRKRQGAKSNLKANSCGRR